MNYTKLKSDYHTAIRFHKVTSFAKIKIITITTINSTRVKPFLPFFRRCNFAVSVFMHFTFSVVLRFFIF